MSMSPPEGSMIERRDDFDGVRLLWSVPTFGPRRYAFAVFFAPFVIGWLAGIVSVLFSVLRGGDLLLLGFLVMWMFAGVWVPLGLWLLLKPSRPESVLLAVYDITHDPGWSAPNYMLNLTTGPQYWLPPKPVTVPKADVTFTLQPELVRLEYEGMPVSIGAILPESDRLWLFSALESWRLGQR